MGPQVGRPVMLKKACVPAFMCVCVLGVDKKKGHWKGRHEYYMRVGWIK